MASTSSEDSCSSSKTARAICHWRAREQAKTHALNETSLRSNDISVILAFAHVGYGGCDECELWEPSTTAIFHATPRLRPEIEGLHTLSVITSIWSYTECEVDVSPFSLSLLKSEKDCKRLRLPASMDRIKEVQGLLPFWALLTGADGSIHCDSVGQNWQPVHAFKPWSAVQNNVPMCTVLAFSGSSKGTTMANPFACILILKSGRI